MKRLLILLTCLFIVLAGFSQPAQDKAKLEKERQEIQKGDPGYSIELQ